MSVSGVLVSGPNCIKMDWKRMWVMMKMVEQGLKLT